MTVYFLDSSALIKHYIAETGSFWIQSLTAASAAHRICIAEITSIELMSGISRQKREGNLSIRTAKAIRLLIKRHASRQYLEFGLTTAIADKAIDLLENNPLRAYDAILLATALLVNQSVLALKLPPLIFLSADNRLLSVANQQGLTTDNPNNH